MHTAVAASVVYLTRLALHVPQLLSSFPSPQLMLLSLLCLSDLLISCLPSPEVCLLQLGLADISHPDCRHSGTNNPATTPAHTHFYPYSLPIPDSVFSCHPEDTD